MKKNAQTQKPERSKNKIHARNSTRQIVLPQRCKRLAQALLKGPVTREKADRLAPASNGPHYIAQLRYRLGVSLPCERVPFVTTDGRPSWFGRYHATTKDREILRKFLEVGK